MMRVLVILVLMFCSTVVSGETVVVAWLPNNENDLVGYKVYYSTRSGSYDEVINVGMPGWNSEGKEEYVVDVAPSGKYYFVVTAYDTNANESDYSNEAWVDFSNVPDSGRWLVTMNDIQDATGYRYYEPGEITLWSGRFTVMLSQFAVLEFKANVFGHGSCLNSTSSLFVGGEELLIDTVQTFYTMQSSSPVEFNFADCFVEGESDANARISELTIVSTVSEDTTIEVVDITDGEVVLEWDLIRLFTDGSVIDPVRFLIETHLDYTAADTGSSIILADWRSISIVAQPDTSYDISAVRDTLDPGLYDFRILPRCGTEIGEPTYASDHDWLVGRAVSGLLPPARHRIFRIRGRN